MQSRDADANADADADAPRSLVYFCFVAKPRIKLWQLFPHCLTIYTSFFFLIPSVAKALKYFQTVFRYGTSSQINQSTSESARKKSYRFAPLKKFEKNSSLAVRHINTIPFLPEKILSTRFTVMEFNTQTKLEIRFSHKNVLPAQNITHFCLPLHLPNLELQL